MLTEQTEKIAICSEYNFRLCFSVPPVLVRFVHLKSFVFPRLQFSAKKFSRLLSNRKQYIGNKLSCQWVIAYVWFSHLIFSSPTMPLHFPPSMYVRVLSFSRCPFRNRISLLYPPLIPFLLLSFWWSFSFQNVFFASLLHPFARLLTLPALSSTFPGCEVMYGPCQRQNQWDAGCFNLAWKPSGSRSSVSWKSDSGGLSLLFLLPPPLSALARCIDQHLAPFGQGSVEACAI